MYKSPLPLLLLPIFVIFDCALNSRFFFCKFFLELSAATRLLLTLGLAKNSSSLIVDRGVGLLVGSCRLSTSLTYLSSISMTSLLSCFFLPKELFWRARPNEIELEFFLPTARALKVVSAIGTGRSILIFRSRRFPGPLLVTMFAFEFFFI